MLAGLLSQVALTGASVYTRHQAAEAKKEWGFVAMSMVGGIIALIFLTAALYMTVSALYTPAIGALATGIVMTVFSLICVYMANRKSGGLRSQQSSFTGDNDLKETIEDIVSEIEQPVREHPGMAILLASIAGFIAADRLR
jgi:hypothetical protein